MPSSIARKYFSPRLLTPMTNQGTQFHLRTPQSTIVAIRPDIEPTVFIKRLVAPTPVLRYSCTTVLRYSVTPAPKFTLGAIPYSLKNLLPQGQTVVSQVNPSCRPKGPSNIAMAMLHPETSSCEHRVEQRRTNKSRVLRSWSELWKF